MPTLVLNATSRQRVDTLPWEMKQKEKMSRCPYPPDKEQTSLYGTDLDISIPGNGTDYYYYAL